MPDYKVITTWIICADNPRQCAERFYTEVELPVEIQAEHVILQNIQPPKLLPNSIPLKERKQNQT